MAPRVLSPLLGAFLLIVMLLHPSEVKPSEVEVEVKDGRGSHGQAFGFLQHLKGCHKGQTVQGLHQLKKYLEKFGYLNYTAPHNHTLAHANDDEFDGRLESAIKTYQLNYHLKVTGSLDTHTVKEMMMPRCGNPDIINGTTSMRSGKKKHHRHAPPSLHTVSHFSFFPGQPKWPPSKTHLTYRFQSSVQVTSIDNLRSICSQAFARWAKVTRFTFQEVQGNTADMVIGFHRRNHGDNAPFDGPGGTLAHAYAPRDGRFHYDADERWSTNPSPGFTDLESVAVHEIGHLLGLMHSSVQGAIMFPTIRSGVAMRELHQDDIQGIRTLYGLPNQ